MLDPQAISHTPTPPYSHTVLCLITLRPFVLGSAFTSDALLGETPDFNLRFPALPKTLEEVSKLISERTELPDTPRLADIVRADPIIAAFVLRRVNSVHHGVRRSVGDVRKAVRLLGYQEVINIAAGRGDDAA